MQRQPETNITMKTTFKSHMTRFLAKEAESLTGNEPVKKIFILAAVGLASFFVCFTAGYYIGKYMAIFY